MHIHPGRKGSTSSAYLMLIGALVFLVLPMIIYFSTSLQTGTIRISSRLTEIFELKDPTR